MAVQRGELSLRTVGTSNRRALGRSSEEEELKEEAVEPRFPKHMIADLCLMDGNYVIDGVVEVDTRRDVCLKETMFGQAALHLDAGRNFRAMHVTWRISKRPIILTHD